MMKKIKIEFEGEKYDAVRLAVPDGPDREDTLLFAECALYEALLSAAERDEFKNEDAERIYESVEYFTERAHKEQIGAKFINALCQENRDYLEMFSKDVVRRCSICGKVMQAGYMDQESDWLACSDACCDEYYAGRGGRERRDADYEVGECFWTEWDSPYYDE